MFITLNSNVLEDQAKLINLMLRMFVTVDYMIY